MINFSLRSTHGAISSRISLARPIKLTYYSRRLLLKLPGDNVCRIPVSAVHRGVVKVVIIVMIVHLSTLLRVSSHAGVP